MSKSATLLLVLVFLTASCLIGVLPVRAGSKTIVVPDDYPTVAAAVGNATDGDTIFINSGTYEGPINQTIVIDKSISLVGENVENTIVNLHPKYNVTWIFATPFYDYSDAIQIDADDVKLANLNLRFIGNMRSNGDRVRIEGNEIWSHSTSTGIFINGSECNIANNTLLGVIDLRGSFNSVVKNNAFSLRLQYAHRNSVYSNAFQILWLDSSNANIISKNTVSTENVMYATQLSNSSNNIFYENYIEVDLWNTNLRIDYNSVNNAFYNNAFMYDYPNHVYNPDYSILYNDKTLVSIASTAYSNSWDNGSVGNYWKNYLLKYPNASEIDGSRIGNTPYVIDENNTDHYPLTQYTMDTTPSPSPTSTQSPEPTPTPEIPEFPSWIVPPTLTAAITLTALIYFKKHKLPGEHS